MNRILLFLTTLILHSSIALGQRYPHRSVCGSDTVMVDYVSLHTGERVRYPAIKCKRVTRFGVRLEAGRSSYIYTPETDRWLGRHNGPSFAFYAAYRDFSLGIRCVLNSITPLKELMVDGKLLPVEGRVNPLKVEYSAGYSLHLKYNFCLEPYVGLTSNKFSVVNEDTLGKHYQIPQVLGFTAGAGLNKYFRIKEYQYLAIFARYAYCAANFRKVNADLGVGYSEWCFGLAYKGFGKNYIAKPLQNTDGLRYWTSRP